MRIDYINKYPTGFLTQTRYQAVFKSHNLLVEHYAYAGTWHGMGRLARRFGVDLPKKPTFTEIMGIKNNKPILRMRLDD